VFGVVVVVLAIVSELVNGVMLVGWMIVGISVVWKMCVFRYFSKMMRDSHRATPVVYSRNIGSHEPNSFVGF